MILKVRLRPLRGIVAVAAGCLVAAGLTTAVVTRGGNAVASTTGGPYGVYVVTGNGEGELHLGSFGAGQSAVGVGTAAVFATAINSTSTFGLASISSDFAPGGIDVFSVPGNAVVASIANAPSPAGFAMDPQDPNRAFSVTPSGEVGAINIAAGSYTVLDGAGTLNPTGASFDATSIAVTPDGGTVLIGAISNSFGYIYSLSSSTPNSTPVVWSSGLRDYMVGDIAVSPDGTAVYGEAAPGPGFTFSTSQLFKVALPLPVNGYLWRDTLTKPIIQARAVTVSPDGQTTYVVGIGGIGPSWLQSYSAGTGALVQTQSVPLTADTNGNAGYIGGVTSVAESPDGGTIVAAGYDYSSTTFASQTFAYPFSTVGLAPGTGSGPLSSSGVNGPEDIAITPDQAPVASLSAASATAGVPLTLNASSSTVTYGSINRYVWTFGDGSPPATTSSPTVSHVYGSAGNYTASVVETDSAGTSVPPAPNAGGSAVNGPGSTPYLNASPSARASAPVAISRPGTPPPPIPTTTTTVPSHATTTTTKPPPAPANHPTLILNPAVGSPGAIISVTGSGFPANTAVKVEWSTRTGSFDETTDGQGKLPAHDLPLITPDVLGPRFAVASVSGSPLAFAGFLAVPDTAKPGGSESGFLFRSEGP